MSEQNALQGCRIVVTRPAEQAEKLAAPLRRLGAEVRVRPLVTIAPPADPAALEAALAALGGFDWVAFTSANAVRWCAAVAPPGVPWPAVACVGEGTARAAAVAAIPVRLVPEVFSGEGLARAMIRHAPLAGVRVLWPRASGAHETFAARLREAGAEVTGVECYRTVPDAAAGASLARELLDEPADVVVFTSPSAARAYGAKPGPPPCAVAVIGEVTGSAVVGAGWPVPVRPAEQSVPGLVAALQRWWADRRH